MDSSEQKISVPSELEAMAGQFQELVRSMAVGHEGLEIESVLHYARTSIPGADHAAITLSRPGQEPETIVATGDLPLRVDALQYMFNEGPCVAALFQNDFVWVNDLATDKEFPKFSPGAVELGIGSMLSTRLFLSEHNRAALNLYSTRAGAFSAEQLPLAAIFASYTSLLLVNRTHQDRVMGLERALESNREIGVAMGILMARRRWNQSEAFNRLVNASQHLNRRLRDVAEEVSSTMKLPPLRSDRKPVAPER